MNTLAVTGVGVILPDLYEACDTKESFWDTVKNGVCKISALEHDREYGIQLAGQVKKLDISQFNLPGKHAKKYSRAAFLGAAAARKAVIDSAMTADMLCDDRTALIVASSVFALENVSKINRKLYTVGKDQVKFDYMLQGTPASVPCAISKLLNLNCPMYTLAGSCVSSPHAIQMACEKLELGQIDRAVIVGVDATIDPVYLLSIGYRMKNGQTISNMSDNPKRICPHDVETDGNACGEGAVAVVLERYEEGKKCAYQTNPFQLYYRNSRENGIGLFDAGKPDNIARSVKKVLESARLTWEEIGFVNDFCEGTGFIEDFFNETVKKIRELCAFKGQILLTNQEAAFGHIGGVTGMIKFLTNLMAMHENIVPPVVNCRRANPGLEAEPVIGQFINKASGNSMIINNGAGGDCSVMLLKSAEDIL